MESMPNNFQANQGFESSLKEQVLRLELEPEARVDDVDEVVDDVAEAAGDDERLPAEDVRPRSGEHGDDYSRPRLRFWSTNIIISNELVEIKSHICQNWPLLG